MNPEQFLLRVIRPTLKHMGMGGPAAEMLLLGTAMVESNLMWLGQLNNGPAEGLYQMEPATANDIWKSYLAYRPNTTAKVKALMIEAFDRVDQLDMNNAYATAMARLQYWRVSEPLPNIEHITEMARYYKEHYNTHLGKSTIEKSLHHFATAYEVVIRFNK